MESPYFDFVDILMYSFLAGCIPDQHFADAHTFPRGFLQIEVVRIRSLLQTVHRFGTRSFSQLAGVSVEQNGQAIMGGSEADTQLPLWLGTRGVDGIL